VRRADGRTAHRTPHAVVVVVADRSPARRSVGRSVGFVSVARASSSRPPDRRTAGPPDRRTAGRARGRVGILRATARASTRGASARSRARRGRARVVDARPTRAVAPSRASSPSPSPSRAASPSATDRAWSDRPRG
jgi:hypothetical protein